jgi:hypothetical protein
MERDVLSLFEAVNARVSFLEEICLQLIAHQPGMEEQLEEMKKQLHPDDKKLQS